ncbi:metallophosphoesterase [Mesorhizobium sp. ES1-4]|uniref:metallophosphoesterase n=1 Tax=Mesorhizobium sp. ES1-4 TaxID=2876627 RepID=UPI001CCFB75C|nr:metallophosphoesterase [Mesorhizobium sp. ES1-4]MBZ9798727.1 metallophosphoesterase [Mesorhizobium sp. ES1-4]
MVYTTKFYTSDTHFSHPLMLSPTACNRPFANIRDMDETLIASWNAVVRPDDIVYHLGDFSMGLHDANRVGSIFKRLLGRKFLILGNHDYARQNIVHPVIAGLGWEQPPCQQLETMDEGQRVFMSHYACRTWPGIRKGGWHFFGHNHGDLPPLGRSRDVGVDCKDVGFSPRTFNELTSGMDLDKHGEAA